MSGSPEAAAPRTAGDTTDSLAGNTAAHTTGTDGAPDTRAGTGTDAARQRLALAQAAMLGALVAGAPVPEGFDRARLRVQSGALTAKRAAVVARIAPELPEILGDGFRPAFVSYARGRPMTGGHRLDALCFVAHLLESDTALPRVVRRDLRRWYRERSGEAPRWRWPAWRPWWAEQR